MKPAKRSRKTLFEVVVTHCPDSPGPYKYAAEVPALPGCFSDGRTEQEALRNVKEAIALYLASRRDQRRRKSHLVEVTL
jgi:predicted RNase H-like HicB family nuclease